MTLLLVVIGVTCSLFLGAFYSGLETAVYSASEVRLRVLASRGDRQARIALFLLQRLPRLITDTLIGTNIAVYAGTFLLTAYFEHVRLHNAEAAATFILLPFFFIFAETLPKRIGHAIAGPFLLHGAMAMRVSGWIFRPLGIILGSISFLLQRTLDRFGLRAPELTGRLQLAERLEASHAEGLLSAEQHQMAMRIMELDEKTVRDVMLSRQAIFTIAETDSCREAVAMMMQANHYRALLIDRGGAFTDRVVTLNAIMRAPNLLDQPVTACASEALKLPANTSVAKAVKRMRELNTRVAIVTSRGGGAVGVVTLSRLLSTVVGGMRL